ncbi:MAG: Holliday junction resolvase RuvX [Patescibacteria group bacterium]|jgi:putative Holliday junction resolvase
MKYLGIDYGEAKVGLAMGDDESGMALPLKIIKNSGRQNLLKELAELIIAEDAGRVVVGLPINTRAESSNQTENVRRFSEELADRTQAEIILHDERFSSQEAQKLRPGAKDDDLAAMIMLQSYLDSQR